jgi:predicted anti-sigma-YlaC factor YlaD
MNCETNEPMVSAFVDGELTEGEETQLFAHLIECASCRAFLQQVTTLRPLVAAVPVTDARLVPLHHQQYRRAGEARRGLWRRRVSVPVPATVAVVFALALSITASLSLILNRAESGREPASHVVYVMEPVEIEGPEDSGFINLNIRR